VKQQGRADTLFSRMKPRVFIQLNERNAGINRHRVNCCVLAVASAVTTAYYAEWSDCKLHTVLLHKQKQKPARLRSLWVFLSSLLCSLNSGNRNESTSSAS